MAAKLETTREQFIADYTDPRWPGTESFLLRHIDGACIFLEYFPEKKQNLCRIHTFKPACCRDWESDLNKPECQEGLKTLWSLSVESSGKISGYSEQILSFENYIQTLSSRSE